MKTCIKITERRHFFSTKVEWDECARCVHLQARKPIRATLSRTPMFDKEKALDYLIILKIVARETSYSRSGLFQRGSTGYAR